MAFLKDIVRLANGLSMVANEALSRRNGGVFKQALISATDLAGLTKGKIRQFDQHKDPQSHSQSIVYFTENENPSSSDLIERNEGSVAQSHEYLEPHHQKLNENEKPSSSDFATRIKVNEGSVAESRDYLESHDQKTEVYLNEIEKPSSSNFATRINVNEGSVAESREYLELESNSAKRSEVYLNESSTALPQPDENPSSSTSSNFSAQIKLNKAEFSENLESHQPPQRDSTNVAENVTHQQVFVKRQRKPRERKVPSTPFSRALGFAGLGAGLAWGTLQESAKRVVFGAPNLQGKQSVVSPFLSEKNAERLALALCRMRGAALKLGQMLSIQDESLVPAPILAALDIVRQGADVMPRSQLNQVLNGELGHDWSSKLKSFDYEPMAAASIGQVHRAVTKDGMDVAMKIQYPGVADSIESDVENVKLLLGYTNLIPEKLYLDNAMKVAKEELSRECDYELEAKNQKRFRILLSGTKGFYVPLVIDELSSKRVLTSELVPGIPIDKVALMDQDTRNYVGRKLLELTLMELFVFRFMQTDPNWSNFLYDDSKKVINLIDFGAAREYPKSFVDDYLRMVLACANNDGEAVIKLSQRLGFLTGEESEVMVDAHVQAGFVVGLPFSKRGGYDFRSNNIAQSISNLGSTMLRHRLTPPPEEAYSLHRKLSGAFLACIKLGAVVPCRELLLEVYEKYEFGEYGSEKLASGSLDS